MLGDLDGYKCGVAADRELRDPGPLLFVAMPERQTAAADRLRGADSAQMKGAHHAAHHCTRSASTRYNRMLAERGGNERRA